jgi:predicted dehydrogenase
MEAPGVSVAAVCDLLEDRLEKARQAAMDKGHRPTAFTDFRKMLDELKDIDAVVIATPVNTHKAIALAALEVGKHVYLEKPLAVTPEDSKLIVQASKSAKGIFQVGFQLRHDPNRSAAMRFIHEGNIGKVLFLQGYRHGGDLPRNTPWYFDRDIAGDNIVEQACHIIDLMVWAVDKAPLRAYGTGGINLFENVPPGRTTMDNYAVIYEFPDDVRFVFSHIYFDPPGFSGIKERVFGAVGAVDLPSATFYERANRGAVPLEVDDAGQNSTFMSLKAFFENARGRKTPLNDGDSGLRSVLTAMMGRQAIYEKRIVTWDEVAG